MIETPPAMDEAREVTPAIDRVIHKALIDASPKIEYLEPPMTDPQTTPGGLNETAGVLKVLRKALLDLLPPPLCGESWDLPDDEPVAVSTTFGKIKRARAALRTLAAPDDADLVERAIEAVNAERRKWFCSGDDCEPYDHGRDEGFEFALQALRAALTAPDDAGLVERYRALLQRIEPHIDAIVCYASDMGEHEPNQLAVDLRTALTPPGDQP